MYRDPGVASPVVHVVDCGEEATDSAVSEGRVKLVLADPATGERRSYGRVVRRRRCGAYHLYLTRDDGAQDGASGLWWVVAQREQLSHALFVVGFRRERHREAGWVFSRATEADLDQASAELAHDPERASSSREDRGRSGERRGVGLPRGPPRAPRTAGPARRARPACAHGGRRPGGGSSPAADPDGALRAPGARGPDLSDLRAAGCPQGAGGPRPPSRRRRPAAPEGARGGVRLPRDLPGVQV